MKIGAGMTPFHQNLVDGQILDSVVFRCLVPWVDKSEEVPNSQHSWWGEVRNSKGVENY
jgi:hypothetical protein